MGKYNFFYEEIGQAWWLLRLGRSLADLASAKRILGIKSKNKVMVEDARDFLELHEDEWNVYANHALATLAAKKDKTPELLPLTEDLKTLREFILRELEKMIMHSMKKIFKISLSAEMNFRIYKSLF